MKIRILIYQKKKEVIILNVKHFIEDKVLLFEFTEELDHHMAENLWTRADYDIERFMPRKVVLDFKKVNFMDSAGIGLIIGRYKSTNCYGGKLELLNVSKKIKRMFEMSGILNIVPIVDELKLQEA